MYYESDKNKVYQEIMNLIQEKHPMLIESLKKAKDMGFRGRAAYFIAYYMMKDEQNKLEKWNITNNLMNNGYSEKTIKKWFKDSDFNKKSLFSEFKEDADIETDIDFGIIKQIPCEKDDLDDNFNDDPFDDEDLDDLDDLFDDDDNFNDDLFDDLDDNFNDDKISDLDDFFDSLDDPFFESNINQENEEDDVKIYKPKKDDFTDDDFGLQDVKISGNDIRI